MGNFSRYLLLGARRLQSQKYILPDIYKFDINSDGKIHPESISDGLEVEKFKLFKL